MARGLSSARQRNALADADFGGRGLSTIQTLDRLLAALAGRWRQASEATLEGGASDGRPFRSVLGT